MKPAFALSLSFDGISLLHRCAGGWRNAGDAALDAPDLKVALAGLRGAAARLEPGPLWTKLILPNDQIRYLTVETGDIDAGMRDQMVRDALTGATPYAVDELVYDISVEGGQTHVAAVARETLAEAEAFALEHDFGPLCFVAIPGRKPFLGEPYFGPTQHAQTALPAGQEVEPDGVAVVVVGPAEFPVVEVPMAAAAEPVTQKASPPPPTAGPAPVQAPGQASVQAPRQAFVQAPGQTAPAPRSGGTVAGAGAAATFSSRRRRAPQATAAAENPAENPAPRASVAPPSKPAPSAPPPSASAPVAPPVAPPSAPPVNLSASGLTAARGGPAPDAPAAPDAPSATAGARLASLMSRRAARAAAQDTDTAAQPETAPAIPPAPAPASAPVSAPESREIDVSAMPPRLAAAVLKTPEPVSTQAPAPQAQNETQRMTVFGARAPAQSRGKPRFLGLILTAVLLLVLAGVAAWASIFLDDGLARIFGRDPDTPAIASRDPGADPAAGALQQASVAALALPEMIAPEIGDTRALSAPVQPEEPVTVVSLDPATAGLTETEAANLETLRDPRTPITPGDTNSDAETRYAATGIWPAAPPHPDTPTLISLDNLRFSTIDKRDLSHSPIAVPTLTRLQTDVPLGLVTPPPAPEVTFDFDERGLVRATPEGALTPDGYVVYQGRPPIVPPATPDRAALQAETQDPTLDERLAGYRPRPRPATLSPPAEPAETQETEAEETGTEDSVAEDTEAETAPVADARLAGFRPRLRPANVTQQAAALDLNEQTTSLLESPQFDGPRPRARPESVAVAAAAAAELATQQAAAEEEARRQEDIAKAAADAAAAAQREAEANGIATATRRAVAQAPRPKDRPSDAARRASRQLAKTETSTGQRASSGASTSGVANTSREERNQVATIAPKTVKPQYNTNASVARQATQNNAINLRRVNLIGVYGTPSNRRALVRLPSGRYKKVSVGDSIDGGRISAIGDSELRYQKGGRNVVLKIPSG